MLYILFCLFIFAVSVDLNNFLSNTFNTTGFLTPFFISLLLIFLFYGIKEKLKIDRYTKIILLLFGIWLIYGGILNIGSPNGFSATFDRVRYYVPSVLYLYSLSMMFNKFFQEGKLLKIIRIITVALVLNSLLITLGSFGYVLPVSTTEGGDEDRMGGLFESVNQAGIVSSIGQIFCLFFVFTEEKNLNKILYFVLYLACLSAAIFTFSKGAFLYSILIVVAFFYYQTFRSAVKTKRSRVSQYFIFILFSVAGFFVFQEMFADREYSKGQEQRIDQFSRLLRGEVNEETTTKRSLISSTATQLIVQDYFMGKGIGSFHKIAKIGYGTHDMYLLILGEIGIIGLLVFIIYYLKIAWSSFKIKVSGYSFLCVSISAVLIMASFVYPNIFYFKLFI
jgi:hypothetical protein